MRKIFVLMILGAVYTVCWASDIYPMYGVASQLGNGGLMPFSDVKYLTIHENYQQPLEFAGDSWTETDIDNDDYTVFVSQSSNNQSLTVFNSQPVGPEILLIIYTLGNLNYYYTSEPVDISALTGASGTHCLDDNAYSDGAGNSGRNYQSMYDRWERQAMHAYDSLTNASVSGSTYVRNKQLLREAQSEMRSIRRRASSAGVHIQKSRYEDATVNLR